ncbi:MAG: glutamine--fructose-6-phosphate transaminase (isomerizing) [Clostridia bacterium]|nr:glutamine--fructose-6-phosphate transaminase (isomerizing) [Clostridia bacterium]
MCGIVGFTGKKNAAPFLLEGLEKLEYRGYDSAGIAVLAENGIKTKKTVERIKTLKEKTDNGAQLCGTIGIGHTRWATHGAPSEENAHPHLSPDAKFAVVHNGIIENYLELKEELAAEGVSFKSETDTEVVPCLLEKYYEGDFFEAVTKAVARLEGSYALGIICTDCPDTLIAVRKFSPLIIGVSKEANYIASDVTAIVSQTKEVIYIDDGEIAVLSPEGVSFFDKDKNPLQKQISVVNWDINAAEKGGYEHFMMKEIMEQPRSVEQTVESRIHGREIIFENLKLDEGKLRHIDKIDIVACGSAYHAGVVGKYVFEELLRIPTQVDLASEYRYRNPLANSKTLTVIISQSGETADTLAALKEAKRKGAHTLSIVNVVGSSIAKESDDVIYTWAGPEIAVATTKGYSTQVAVLYLFAIWAARILKSSDEEYIESLFDSLRELPENIQKILDNSEDIKALAEKCGDPHSLFFIGRNIDYAVSLEASLKLKEISYIHSEAYAAGELKHGTISLIEEGRTVIALACYEKLFDKLLSNIKEVKARGANIIACVTEGHSAVLSEANDVIFIPQTHPLLTASLEVIPFQLYSYYVSLFKGCDIDKPRNLAKSVTVE